jgi:hypothetical protein
MARGGFFMRATMYRLNGIARSHWTAFAGALASILGFLLYLWETMTQKPTHALSIGLVIVGISLFLLALLYTIYIRQENDALRDMSTNLHIINHNYRDIIHSTFAANNPIGSRRDLVKIEREVLHATCQRISEIFTRLLHGRPCVVTVKLITTGTHGARICKTYIRSDANCERERYGPDEFQVGTNKNTALDTALMLPEPGKCAHFHSADLTADHHYQNERAHWQNFYRSAIVVPIRYVDNRRIGHPDASQDLGFLSVDTLSRNWLNNGSHVQLLAAFADQMYYFMSLMRGRFNLQPAGGD